MDGTTPNLNMYDIYQSLPSDVQLAIYAPETFDAYDEIASRYALDETQREVLGIQTGLLLMGLTQPKDFIPVLSDTLGLPRDKAAFIAQEINKEVLNNVKESLKMVHGLLPQEAPIESPYIQTSTMQEAVPAPESVVIPAEIPPEGRSVIEQKLGSMFKMAPGTAAPEEAASTPNRAAPTTPAPEKPKVDPYREMPT